MSIKKKQLPVKMAGKKVEVKKKKEVEKPEPTPVPVTEPVSEPAVEPVPTPPAQVQFTHTVVRS